MKVSHSIKKVIRFIGIYGFGRTWFKVAGRMGLGARFPRLRSPAADIGIVGCGQFAFATIGYFLQSRFGHRLLCCYDIDSAAAKSLARGLRVSHVSDSPATLFSTPGLRTVYIASNHASHSAYAVQALDSGLDVYIEKPVAVTFEQLAELSSAQRRASGRLFAGYNRPFSAAIRELRRRLSVNTNGGITLQCFVVGHLLAADHWYRLPEEGTRICGNVGHWLDLFVHILYWRKLPNQVDISISWANESEADDNVCISLVTDLGDLCSIVLSARAEPFEGINESINLQHGEAICKIDDFRRMTMWEGPRVSNFRFWPKDPGHRDAILQPYVDKAVRPWREVEDSTLLMLHITDMVRRRVRISMFSFGAARADLERSLQIK